MLVYIVIFSTCHALQLIKHHLSFDQTLYFAEAHPVESETTEEEFLQHFNLSKCDRSSTNLKSVIVAKKPQTRSFVKMRVAKRMELHPFTGKFFRTWILSSNIS